MKAVKTDPDRYLESRADGRFRYQRRVPTWAQSEDGRSVVKVSLRTHERDVARRRRDEMEAADDDYWRSLVIDEDRARARARYDAAVARALAHGFVYRSAADLAANAPVGDLLDRFERLDQNGGARPRRADAEALLGLVDAPRASWRDALQVFFKEIAVTEQQERSPEQLRIWTNDHKRPVENLVAAIGDKEIFATTREDARAFKQWLANSGLATNSANKQLGTLRKLYRQYAAHVGEEGRENPFRALRFKEKKVSQIEPKRPPFTVEWIRDKILAPGAFDQGRKPLNDEATDAVLALVEPGCRPSEILNLRPEDIHLDHDIPHIVIAIRDDRLIKSGYSERRVPLLGVSLEAMRRRPNGFPRYRDRGGSFSNLVNGYMKTHGLRPTDKHTVYSLRHSFEQRMKDADVDFELRCLIMGHKIERPAYGQGEGLLRTMAAAMERVAVSVRL